jgi:hypothetical protein
MSDRPTRDKIQEIADLASSLSREGKLTLEVWAECLLDLNDVAPGYNAEFLMILAEPSWRLQLNEAILSVEARRKAARSNLPAA